MEKPSESTVDVPTMPIKILFLAANPAKLAIFERADTGQFYDHAAKGWTGVLPVPVGASRITTSAIPGVQVHEWDVTPVPPAVSITAYLYRGGRPEPEALIDVVSSDLGVYTPPVGRR